MDTGTAPIEWQISKIPVEYEAAVEAMEQRVAAIRDGTAAEIVWLLEHPPLYTAGTSAREEDLLDPQRLPVHRTGRGGRYTYHGPSQRIAYVMLDLSRRGRDVRCHVHRLEEWMIRTLARFGVSGERRAGRVGASQFRSPSSADRHRLTAARPTHSERLQSSAFRRGTNRSRGDADAGTDLL